jgi:hypothetical protein
VPPPAGPSARSRRLDASILHLRPRILKPGGEVFRYFLLSNALGAGFVWWIIADLSTAARVTAGVALVAATVMVFLLMLRRSRRLRSEWEGHPPQVLRHDGGGGRRRARPRDDRDFELFVHDRW